MSRGTLILRLRDVRKDSRGGTPRTREKIMCWCRIIYLKFSSFLLIFLMAINLDHFTFRNLRNSTTKCGDNGENERE